MKPIAIAFSDIHLHKFKAFDKDGSRLDWSFKAFKKIADKAFELNVPLIFCGDLFHTPLAVDNEVITKTLKFYRYEIDAREIPFICISGNHDMSEKNGLNNRAPSYLDGFTIFETFNLLNTRNPVYVNGMAIQGIPYYNSDTELKKTIKRYKKYVGEPGLKILLLHGDCPGAVEANGIAIDENKAIPRNVDKFFKPWDLVLFGHIHVAQKISKKCYMLGSPIHQTSGDKSEMGYWQIFIGKPPKFIGLVGYPKFRKLGPGEEPDNDLDYFIPYEEMGKVEEVEKGDFDLSLPREKLAKKYLKRKGIKDKQKKRALINALNEVE